MGKITKNVKKNKFVVSQEAKEINVVAKKAKKNKIIEASVDNNNERVLSGPKPKKAKKNKFVKSPLVATEINNVKSVKKETVDSDDDDASDSESSAPKAIKAKKLKQNKLQNPAEEADENVSETAEEFKSEPNKFKIKREKRKNNKKNAAGNGVVAEPHEQNKFQQFSQGVTEEMKARYPVLNDEAVANQFLAVKLTNTAKGRMRQIFKSSLQGTPEALIPDVLNNRIKIILKTPTLTETALRKLRVLYSMLKTALMTTKPNERKQADKNKVKSEDGEKTEQKLRGPKRWVVFIGNLPMGITEEKIKEHFSDLGDNIKDIRIPKKGKDPNDPKSAITFMEVADNLNFELALSKHHTMLDNRRINVLYTAQSGSKMSKTKAKGKSAKLVALQKSGKLAGSIPLSQKRSARRKKMKEAQKAEAS